MERIRDIIISMLFILIMGITAFQTKIWDRVGELVSVCVVSADQAETLGELEVSEGSISDIEDTLLEKLTYKDTLVDLSGLILKQTHTRSYYNNLYGLNITRTGYNVGSYSQTSTDYEVEQMIQFQDYLHEKGIQLLYVSEPAKYIDDAFYQNEFGGESYLNRNTDLFLSRIGKAGIEYVDLRENIIAENMDPLTLFYRTDHHWTVPASKWAAKIIAQRLNEDYGYHIDLNLYDDSQFHTEFYEDAWLGEQGREIAQSYIGLDDYTVVEPLYDTSYVISGANELLEGDFGLFINKDIYDLDVDPYTSPSWHYSYYSYENCNIHNNNIDYGKVLVIGDSYESSMLPFLSLAFSDVSLIIPRNLEKQSVREVIESSDYDTVIIAYAQFMIGAHDNESSSNYNMFTFD